MAKDNYDSMKEYLDLYEEVGSIGFKKQNNVLDGKIEDTILDILFDLNDISRIDVSSDVVRRMFDLANLITERFCDGRKFEVTDSMITLLSRELRENIKNSEHNPYLILGNNEKVKNVVLTLGDVPVLGIDVFDDDRFSNELMISCNKVRGGKRPVSARIISPSYILGDNGIYINSGEANFLDEFRKNDTEEFESSLNLKYYYIDYFKPEDKIYIDRASGIKLVTDEDIEQSTLFSKTMLDIIMLGGRNRTDSEIVNLIYKPVSNNFEGAKIYKKINE